MILVPWWAVLLAVLAVVVLVAALLASATATRLNRMHVRTDLARTSLEAAPRLPHTRSSEPTSPRRSRCA